MRRVAASLVALFLVSACATTSITGSTTFKACHTSADCGGGQSCLFAVYDSCGMPGVCTAAPDGSACIQQTACGCNGATISVCLVNGDSPSPVSSLGSCDGATQQGFDANVPESAAPPPPPPDASDSGGTSPTDSGPSPDDAGAVDASDASNTTLLGTPCSSSTQCASDPVYNGCHHVNGNEICTTTCPSGLDTECQPPSNGVCNTSGATFYCALN
jgi:hypothetical protein